MLPTCCIEICADPRRRSVAIVLSPLLRPTRDEGLSSPAAAWGGLPDSGFLRKPDPPERRPARTRCRASDDGTDCDGFVPPRLPCSSPCNTTWLSFRIVGCRPEASSGPSSGTRAASWTGEMVRRDGRRISAPASAAAAPAPSTLLRILVLDLSCSAACSTGGLSCGPEGRRLRCRVRLRSGREMPSYGSAVLRSRASNGRGGASLVPLLPVPSAALRRRGIGARRPPRKRGAGLFSCSQTCLTSPDANLPDLDATHMARCYERRKKTKSFSSALEKVPTHPSLLRDGLQSPQPWWVLVELLLRQYVWPPHSSRKVFERYEDRRGCLQPCGKFGFPVDAFTQEDLLCGHSVPHWQ